MNLCLWGRTTTSGVVQLFPALEQFKSTGGEARKEPVWMGRIRSARVSLQTSLSGCKRNAACLKRSFSLFSPALPTDEGPPLPCMKLRVTVCCEPSEYPPRFISSPFKSRSSLPLLCLLSGLYCTRFSPLCVPLCSLCCPLSLSSSHLSALHVDHSNLA